MSAQRVRIWFRKGERVRYISHLDTLRYWERCIRRAGLPLSYSQGFTPHPKLAFAGPLPLGFLAEAEVLDVTLDERVPVAEFLEHLAPQTSEDLSLVRAEEIPLSTPSPQSCLRWAEYDIMIPDVPAEEASAAVCHFMALPELQWVEERREKARTYDIRATAAAVSARTDAKGGTVVSMRLQATQDMMSRPEQVLAAMLPGVEASRIVRTRLVFDEGSPAHEAWRRRGRFEE